MPDERTAEMRKALEMALEYLQGQNPYTGSNGRLNVDVRRAVVAALREPTP